MTASAMISRRRTGTGKAARTKAISSISSRPVIARPRSIGRARIRAAELRRILFLAAWPDLASQYWLRWLLPLIGVLRSWWDRLPPWQEAIPARRVVVGVLFVIVWLVAHMAEHRHHDQASARPRLAVAVYLAIVRAAVDLWPMIEIMFLRGTIGSNRFGADPVPRQLERSTPAACDEGQRPRLRSRHQHRRHQRL